MGENKTLLDRLHKAAVAYVNSLSYEQADYFKKGGRLIPKHKKWKWNPYKNLKTKVSLQHQQRRQDRVFKNMLSLYSTIQMQLHCKRKRANFARNAAKWKHAKGGVIKSLENFDAQSFRKWLDENYGQPN